MAQPKLRDRNCVKKGCSTKLDKIDTDIGTCLPTQVAVSVSLNLSSCTQVDSKPIIAMFVKNFW